MLESLLGDSWLVQGLDPWLSSDVAAKPRDAATPSDDTVPSDDGADSLGTVLTHLVTVSTQAMMMPITAATGNTVGYKSVWSWYDRLGHVSGYSLHLGVFQGRLHKNKVFKRSNFSVQLACHPERCTRAHRIAANGPALRTEFLIKCYCYLKRQSLSQIFLIACRQHYHRHCWFL